MLCNVFLASIILGNYEQKRHYLLKVNLFLLHERTNVWYNLIEVNSP